MGLSSFVRVWSELDTLRTMKKHKPRKPVSGRYQLIMKTFADRLREAREQSGRYKSAAQFANVLGIEPHAYRKYERGQSEPNFDTLTRICELLELTPNQLLPHAARKGRKGNDGSDPRAVA
jgi:ribosome-binding protein aMBF1 (putative translation factor)